ncbi:MAG: ATP-binding protein [Myxococcota bacterium]
MERHVLRLNRRIERERAARRAAEIEAESTMAELGDRQREAQLMRAIATAANQAPFVADALKMCLRELSVHVGASVGHAWMVPDETPLLVATGLWFIDDGMWYLDDPHRFRTLQGMTDASTLRRGEGLPGRVLETGTPAWIEDVGTDRSFSRNMASSEVGVRAGFALPVLMGERVAAVLEFFFVEHRPADERILALAADIGAQVGRVLERHRAQTELARARDDLQSKEARVRERTLELERLNDDLQAQIAERDAADAANRAKSEFLANMSHEIRTPLTAVLGYADLLMDPSLGATERLDHVKTIRRNGEHLLTLLNDILDLSKIEAGKMVVESIACSPSRIVVDVASLMRVRALEKQLGFSIAYLTPIPDQMVSDPTRIRQILMNLVGNAIKFTQKGEVRVTVKLDGLGTASPTISFAVIDDGIGMSREQLGRLFQPFTQADGSTTRKYGGTGLGLVICKRLVEMMDGKLTVDSQPGVGSTFTVTVPTGALDGVALLENLEEAGSTPEPVSPSGGTAPIDARVLLAEDGHDNQILLSTLLRRAGATVTLAENGRIAVDKATSGTYDVILMDMQMPEMDGYQAASTLRTLGYTGPIVALTAHAMATDRARCIAAGCSDYLTKPIDRTALFDTIRRWAATQRAAEPVPQPEPQSRTRTHPPPPARIATEVPLHSEFEDDPELRELVIRFVTTLPERADAIRAGLARDDQPVITRLAHQLKGSAPSYGFPTIGAAAARLEDACRSGDPVAREVTADELLALIGRARLIDRAGGMSA